VLEEDLRPNWATLAAGCSAVALVSATLLPWPDAAASTVLEGLMVAGADVDARMFLLPDVVTWGTACCGVLAAAVLRSSRSVVCRRGGIRPCARYRSRSRLVAMVLCQVQGA
jgi:hypothetical protein